MSIVSTFPSQLNAESRMQSVDFLRGVIMVLMAIDHVRVYSGLPAGGPEAGIFFTRWVTHFCAPGFVFLAGTSAFLLGRKITRQQLFRYLLTRGLLLVVLELTLIRFLWSFNLHLGEFMLAGVIWMIGWCMVIMAALVWIRPAVVGWLGVLIIFAQQLFALVPAALPEAARPGFGKLWEFVYPAGLNAPEPVAVLYVIVPWIGVMMAGYGFGLIITMNETERKKWCLRIGLGSIVLFIALAGAGVFFDKEDTRPFIFSLLDQRKYPASQLYLLMTLGPLIAVAPFVGNLRGLVAHALVIFGRVPFFYYLCHILIIHLSALAVQFLTLGSLHHDWYNSAPFAQVPEENRWTLGLLYLVFIIDVALLYYLCTWYARYKEGHRSLVTRYV